MMLQQESDNRVEVDGIVINLRHRGIAALLAWLIPGLGHYYQQRYAKGTLYAVCILFTYWIGFAVGGIHVVYASWFPGDRRWHYVCQAGIGLPSLPALIQTSRMNRHTKQGETTASYEPLWGGVMAPPRRPVFEEKPDEISAWYARQGAGYEMGTWYTMIAGLLNILVIFDAYAGPLSIPISGRKKNPEVDSKDVSGET